MSRRQRYTEFNDANQEVDARQGALIPRSSRNRLAWRSRNSQWSFHQVPDFPIFLSYRLPPTITSYCGDDMKTILLLVVCLLLFGVHGAIGQNSTVRVVFFTGQVSTKGRSVSIGQELGRNDVVTVGSGATLQISVNGKVLRYNKATSVRVADAIRQAGSGENTAVANTVRTLAAASGAGSGGRASQAGATRLGGDRQETTERARTSLDAAHQLANDELSRRLGIDNALFKFESEVRNLYGEDDMLILEPRSSATRLGAIRFRWLRSPTAGGYVVTVRDHVGDKVFETTTNDTTAVWESPALTPGVLYSWKLSDQRNSLHSVQAYFWQLDPDVDRTVTTGMASIRKELGDDNPAVPMVMGAYLQDNGLFGEAAREYVTGAEATPERYKDFMDRALDIYAYDIGMSVHELLMVTPQH